MMRDRVGQALVAVVRALKINEAAALEELTRQWLGDLRPRERPRGNRLLLAVNRDRIVRCGRAEPVAPLCVARVSERAGINQPRRATGSKLERQLIGVRVAARLYAVWAAIDHCIGRRFRPAITHHEVAAL